MAIHKSAKKRIRRTTRHTAYNKARVSGMRTSIRKVEEAIAAGDAKAAQEALKAAQPKIAKTAHKGMIHKKNASRKISRLSAQIKNIKKK